MIKKYLSTSPSQTKKFGACLAKKILSMRKARSALSAQGARARQCEFLKSKEKSAVIGLEGNLGSGKTTFLQGFARGLGIKEKITSPTFVIMKKFIIRGNSRPDSRKFVRLYHIDCYRIKKPKDLLDLGFKEIVSNPQNIIAIEWPELIYKILPNNTLIMKFEFLSKRVRKIKIKL